jgi:hypothetical protein
MYNQHRTKYTIYNWKTTRRITGIVAANSQPSRFEAGTTAGAAGAAGVAGISAQNCPYSLIFFKFFNLEFSSYLST